MCSILGHHQVTDGNNQGFPLGQDKAGTARKRKERPAAGMGSLNRCWYLGLVPDNGKTTNSVNFWIYLIKLYIIIILG